MILRHWTQIASLLVSVGIVVAIWVIRPNLAALQGYGLIGVFLIMAVSGATILVPLPGLMVALAAGQLWNPFLVGLAGGLGRAVGELTGYLAGYGSRAVIEEHPNRTIKMLEGWVRRYGFLAIVVLSALPNPIFDTAGVIAGALRFPVWKFFLAVAIGNCIKVTYIAWAGAGMGTLFGV